MIKTYKVMLLPNHKQETKLFQFAGAARFAYNWTLERQIQNYKNGNKFLLDGALRKEFTQLKKQAGFEWLNNISNDVTKQAVKDACQAYKNFFKHRTKYPRFKSKKKSRPSFYQDTWKIQFKNGKVKLESIANNKKSNRQKINWVRLAEKDRIPTDVKYYNLRIISDGLNWWISVGVEESNSQKVNEQEGIGVDLGLKDLAICSNETVYPNINKTKEIKQLEKQKRRLQHSVSRSYEKNKKGASYCKTNNVIKKEKKLLKINHRLTNIRQNYIHQITSEIIKREPSFICMEDLNVSGMMKNKHLSKAIIDQKFYEFRRIMQYKCKWNNIMFILVDKWFPSSKLCSVCGTIKRDLKLSDRIYECGCGNVIDRDLQAAINLKNYGEKKMLKLYA